MPDRYFVVLTTAGSDDEAETLARELVTRRLAACVNIAPVSSVYRWNGEVQREEERLLVVKTAERLIDRVTETIHELHSYETPEVIAMPIERGSTDYLEWLGASLAPPD